MSTTTDKRLEAWPPMGVGEAARQIVDHASAGTGVTPTPADLESVAHTFALDHGYSTDSVWFKDVVRVAAGFAFGAPVPRFYKNNSYRYADGRVHERYMYVVVVEDFKPARKRHRVSGNVFLYVDLGPTGDESGRFPRVYGDSSVSWLYREDGYTPAPDGYVSAIAEYFAGELKDTPRNVHRARAFQSALNAQRRSAAQLAEKAQKAEKAAARMAAGGPDNLATWTRAS